MLAILGSYLGSAFTDITTSLILERDYPTMPCLQYRVLTWDLAILGFYLGPWNIGFVLGAESPTFFVLEPDSPTVLAI